jgi:hypothetical protein
MLMNYAALSGLLDPHRTSTQGCALGCHILPFQGKSHRRPKTLVDVAYKI